MTQQGATLATLTGSASGTIYISGNPAIATVSSEGLVTAVGTGATSVTVINGPAEKVIPVLVEAPELGPAGPRPRRGRRPGPGRLARDGRSALADDETVSISPVAPLTLPMAAPSDLIAVAAFQLDLGPDPLSVPVQLSVAAAPGTPSGTNVIFYRADTLPDSSGNPVPVWMQVATGVVGTDGFASRRHQSDRRLRLRHHQVAQRRGQRERSRRPRGSTIRAHPTRSKPTWATAPRSGRPSP